MLYWVLVIWQRFQIGNETCGVLAVVFLFCYYLCWAAEIGSCCNRPAFWLSILCSFHLIVFGLRNATTEEASDSEATRVMGELIRRPLKYLVIFLAFTDFPGLLVSHRLSVNNTENECVIFLCALCCPGFKVFKFTLVVICYFFFFFFWLLAWQKKETKCSSESQPLVMSQRALAKLWHSPNLDVESTPHQPFCYWVWGAAKYPLMQQGCKHRANVLVVLTVVYWIPIRIVIISGGFTG